MSTVDTEPAAPLTYRFGGGGAGIWLGLGTSRLAVLGAGLLAAVVGFTAGVPAAVAALPLLGGLALSAARLAGRPLLDWASPAATHHVAGATGARRWCAPYPPRPAVGTAVRLGLPGEYGRPRVRRCDDDPSVGLLTDPTTATVTVVFEVAGVDRFPLLEAADRDALLAGWGRSLSVLADTDEKLTRLQLLERAYPPPDPAAADEVSGSDAGDRDLAVLYRCIDSLATAHDSRLAVQWSFGRLDASSLAGVASRCRAVSRSLLSARLLTRPLDAAALTAEISLGLRGHPGAGAATAVPGPLSRRSSWSHVQTDDTFHRCYAVAGWPQSPVAADWLTPLLLAAPTGVTRTVAVHLERLDAAAAARTARTARAKATLDQRDRVRLGMATSAATDNAEAGGVAMDEELAAGYRTHRLVALVTLSAPRLAAIDDADPVIRQAAAAARLELRPLHGQHDRALAATLPLCRIRPKGQS